MNIYVNTNSNQTNNNNIKNENNYEEIEKLSQGLHGISHENKSENLSNSYTSNSKLSEFYSTDKIYTIDPRNNNLISFSLSAKKYELINYIDKTNKEFLLLLNNKNNFPTLFNTNNGLFIVLDNNIYFYNPQNNILSFLTRLNFSHNKSSLTLIKNEIYIISGKGMKNCEKYNLYEHKIYNIPSVNYEKVYAGICHINKYIFSFFGEGCNSIEKLNIENLNNPNWDIINYKINNQINDNLNLQNCICIFDDYANIIIFGGKNSNNKINENAFYFDLGNVLINKKIKFTNPTLFNCQSLAIEYDIFVAFDVNGNLHAFDKDISFHKIYNGN